MAETPKTRWAEAAQRGAGDGASYARRFADLAASGQDMHGEATFCASRLAPGARVLDAGCGTGRVAVRLAELGFDCVGIDVDAAMLAVARAASIEVTWQLLDLVEVDALPGGFDLVVAAGNVIPLLAAGTEAQVVAGLAGRLAPGGELVVGFGLDAAHLPLPAAPFGLEEYDGWCRAARLELVDRFSTWSAAAYVHGTGYAVSVHRTM